MAVDLLAAIDNPIPFFAPKRSTEGIVHLYLHKDMQAVSTSDLVSSQGKDILHVAATKYKSKLAAASIKHLEWYAKEKLTTPQQKEPKAKPKSEPDDDLTQKHLTADERRKAYWNSTK